MLEGGSQGDLENENIVVVDCSILSARVEGKRYANISGIPRSIFSKFGKHKNS